MRITTFTQLEPIPYLSKRFLLERYLDLSEEEMTRNDELWAQENGVVQDTDAPAAGLRSVGVTNAGLQQDMDTLAPEAPMPGADGVPPQGQPNMAGAAPEAGAGGGLGL